MQSARGAARASDENVLCGAVSACVRVPPSTYASGAGLRGERLCAIHHPSSLRRPAVTASRGYGQKYRQRCTRRYSPACRRRSRTSRQSSPATQPSCTCAAHACAIGSTSIRRGAPAAGAQRASVRHMHPCNHEARECFPRSRPTRLHPGSSSVADQRMAAAWQAC